MHLFSTNCKNCTGVGSQNSSVVQVGKFVLETSGRLSKSVESLKESKNSEKIILPILISNLLLLLAGGAAGGGAGP